MNFPKFLLFGLLSFSTSFISQADSHSVSIGIDNHLDQESSTGYHFGYQWRFTDFIEFEARYIAHNTLEVSDNDNNYVADVDRIIAGLNLIKHYNDSLIVKAGLGVSQITSSDNDSFVEQNSIAPYLQLAANYKINQNVAIEFGQQSFFDGDLLDNNHNFYLSVSFTFGEGTSQPKQESTNNSAVVNNKNLPKNASTKNVPSQVINNTKTTANKEHITEAISPAQIASFWYVQFGAFKNNTLAKKSLTELRAKHPNLTFDLTTHQGLTKILSSAYLSKDNAKQQMIMLKSRYNLSGFITQLPH